MARLACLLAIALALTSGSASGAPPDRASARPAGSASTQGGTGAHAARTPAHKKKKKKKRRNLWHDKQGFVPHTGDRQSPDLVAGSTLGAGDYDNSRIAEVALSHVGQRPPKRGLIDHGQCKQAVNDWVATASGSTQRLGGNYFYNYSDAGGRQVGSPDDVMPGDIIQLYSEKDVRRYFRGMHTAVVVSHEVGSTSFDVVDSNWKGDGRVRRHRWDPYASARAYKLSIAIWRMGSVPALPGPANPPDQALTDVTPPTAPSGLTVDGITSNSFNLSWGAASDDNGIADYGVYFNGQLTAHTTATQYGFSKLGCGTAYSVGVVAFDGAGNESGRSTIQASTNACPPPPPSNTYAETVGGNAHTWTNYATAGGTEGPIIPAYTTVQVACKVQGFRVADGNTWWYRIASSPWNGTFYASADAFYNNGATSGSLVGTPFVDPNVRDC